MRSGSARRTMFSACTRAVYGSASQAPGSMASTASRASYQSRSVHGRGLRYWEFVMACWLQWLAGPGRPRVRAPPWTAEWDGRPRLGDGGGASVALVDGHELAVFGPGVVRRGADDLAVDALLDDVRAPPRGACDHEQRGEHGGGHAHHVVAHGAEPVQVREHLLDVPHHRFQALGDVVHLHAALLFRQLARDRLDHLVARIADSVDRMAETDDDFLARHPLADVRLGLVRGLVALLDLEGDLVGAAVLGPAQRADAAGDARMHVAAGARGHAAGEGAGGGIVPRVGDQGGMDRL